MSSNVIISIHSAAHTCAQENEYDLVEYNSTTAPPFFEGHALFLEPVSRTCEGGRTRAKFRRNTESISLTPSLLKNLLEIFVFFQENQVSFKNATVENFAVQRDRLVVARPWDLRGDIDGSMLSDCQRKSRSLFQVRNLHAKENHFFKQFYLGTSPKKLFRHPIFWTTDRVRCFILDLAGSRFLLNAEVKLSSNWLLFLEKPQLKGILDHQKKFYGDGFSLDGKKLIDLMVFTANVVKSFLPLSLRFVTLER